MTTDRALSDGRGGPPTVSPAPGTGPIASSARRRDAWALDFELTVCFDTNLGRSRYDFVGMIARCVVCGTRFGQPVDPATPGVLVRHARTHEWELSRDEAAEPPLDSPGATEGGPSHSVTSKHN